MNLNMPGTPNASSEYYIECAGEVWIPVYSQFNCTGKGVKIYSANQGTVRQLDWLSGDAICKKRRSFCEPLSDLLSLTPFVIE